MGEIPEIETHLGIIGDPIGHTLSPMMHRLFGQSTGNALTYEAYQVHAQDLGTAVSGALALGIRGMNVTVPHKSAVIPFLASADPTAEKIGAVNTLVYDEGGYRGFNTDVSGLKQALESDGVRLEGVHAVILGAGGAARAAAFLLAENGAAEVLILNRTAEKAVRLAGEVCEKCGVDHVRAVTLETFLSEAENGRRYLAIQCTSVGLAPDVSSSVVTDRNFFDRLFYALDIVYRPFQTRFLALAREAGVPGQNGLPMLVFQAADSFRLWFPDSTLSRDDLRHVMQILKEQLLGFSGLFLTGFMGCGKTTVSQALARILGYDVWDTDSMIEEACGKKISRIFRDEGEESFRILETETLRRISESLQEPWEGETDGVVVSTGGGLPGREENRELLRKSRARVVYLRVQPRTVLERLADDSTRPLLAGSAEDKEKRITGLMAERAPAYEECADLTVDTDGKSPQQIAVEILSALTVV